jgi:hypothetical protein
MLLSCVQTTSKAAAMTTTGSSRQALDAPVDPTITSRGLQREEPS